jgi:acylphosphatase
MSARRFCVHGRVQGVGFRYFVQKHAAELGLTGFVRNLDDGSVEVYAVGSDQLLDALAGLLHEGPHWSEVRTVEVREEAVSKHSGFRIT